MSASARLLLAALSALALCGCPQKGGGGHKRRGGRPADAAVAVAVEAVRAETMRETLVAHAALEPESIVDVPARVEGRAETVHVEAGDIVKKGQILVTLDSTRADLRVREATLALRRTETSLARTAGLSKKGLATKEELEEAKQAVAQATLALEATELDKADTELRSPISGVITERLVSAGDTLSAGAIAYRVADRDPLLARARVPEAQAERLAVGNTAWVIVEGRKGRIRGEVIRVAPLVDLESGTVIATIAVRDTAGIRLNRFASLEIITGEREGAITIPQAALALRGEEDRVLVCEGQGAATIVRQRLIVTGVRNGDRIEVLSGLKVGERVVVAAPDDLRDGAQVRVVTPHGEESGASAPKDDRAEGGERKHGHGKTRESGP